MVYADSRTYRTLPHVGNEIASKDPEKSDVIVRSQWLFGLGLLGIGLFLIIILAFVKTQTILSFWVNPFFVVYTLFVTTFELSRILGAILYEKYVAPVLPKDERLLPYRPKVSFVIPCKNEGAAIEKTMTKCFEAEYPRHLLEVIVINDGSTDDTKNALLRAKERFPELTVVDWEVNQGKRHAMAEGFRRATGEIVVQLDSDSWIEPSTFSEIIEPFRDPSVGAVCAHADPENADKNFVTKIQAAYYFMSFRILKAAESAFFTVFCCSGCSSAYRKSLITPILDEWLDERFLGKPVTWGDDRSLTNWVLRQGYHTIYAERARAFTICPEDLKTLLKQQVRWKKGWFVNSLFASKFILSKEPFIALTYFFPLIFITLVTPFMAIKALVYNPIMYGSVPLFYVVGVFLVAAILTTYYRFIARNNRYWPYMFVWSALNLIILSFILFYALATIQNRRWGTR